MDESCHPDVEERRKPDAEAVAAPRPAPEPAAAPAARVPVSLDPEAVLAACDMEFMRAGGPGGQHRNRRETGVRLTHRPTGIVVIATERRSQAANREMALERMVERLEKRMRKPKPRKPTKKSRGVRSREVDSKKRHGAKKAERRGGPGD